MTQLPSDPRDALFVAHRGDLKSRSARGGAVSVVAQMAMFVLGVGSMMYLGRVLDPADFGIVAMAYSVLVPVLEIREAGLPAAMVQQKNIDARQGNALFWNNFRLQAIIALLVGLVAWPAAVFYGEPRVTSILLLFALMLLITGMSLMHRGLLRRQMRFQSVAGIELGGEVLGVATACVSAAMGAGFWSLVILQLVAQYSRSAAYWFVARWSPGWPMAHSCEGTDQMRTYGRQVTGSRIIEQFVNKLDQILVGFYVGETALGLYNRAYKWSAMPIRQLLSPLQQVMVSGSSKVRHNPEKFREFFSHGLTVAHMIVIPVMFWLFISAGDFIRVLLGPKWGDAVPIFRVLVLGGLMGSTVYMTRWLYLAEGTTKRQLAWSMGSAPILVVGVFVGVNWGAYGVAWGFAATTSLLAIPRVAHATRDSILTQRDYWKTAWRPLLAGACAAAPAYWLQFVALQETAFYYRMPLVWAAFVIGYGLAFLILPGGVREAKVMLDNIRSIR